MTYDYDTRWNEGHPTEDELVADMVAHLAGTCPPYCDLCYEEAHVAWYGIEAVTLHDVAMEREAEAMAAAGCPVGA